MIVVFQGTAFLNRSGAILTSELSVSLLLTLPTHNSTFVVVFVHAALLLYYSEIFSNLLLSNFDESVRDVISVCCSYMTGVEPSVVFCCCRPCAAQSARLCVQRCKKVFSSFSEHSLYNHPSIEIVLWENPSRSVVLDILRHIHSPFVLIHSA